MDTATRYKQREDHDGAADKRRNVSHQIAILDDEAVRSLCQDLLNSTSWRITAPLRFVSRQFHKFRKAPLVSTTRLGTFSNFACAIRNVLRVEPKPSSTSMPMESIARFSLLQDNFESRLILVGADIPPMFDRQSGALRLYTMMRILFEAGWRLVFASQATRAQFEQLAGSPADRGRYEDHLRNIGVKKIAYGPKEINALLQVEGANIGRALLSFPDVAHNLIPWITLYAPSARIIYDMVDFHYLRMMREADLQANGEIRSSALRMREKELANARTSDVTIAISENERQALRKLDGGIVVEVVPNIFEISADCDPAIAARKNLLFVGGFMHSPNIDAVLWFVDQVWPLIQRQRPNLKFIIAGSFATREVLALADRPGVEVAGYVEDLAPLFCCSRVFVAPLRYGAGVKGKVGQSMAQGLPVVATTVAAEGMNAEVGKDLLVADEPTAFSAAVIKLLDDDTLWLQMRANGQKLIRNTQSVEAARIKLEEILNG